METNGKGATKIRLKWIEARPDPMQYKPWSPVLEPQQTFIEVNVDNKHLANDPQKSDTVVLTPDGMAQVLKTVATALMRAYSS